jgi:hypothetical protein
MAIADDSVIRRFPDFPGGSKLHFSYRKEALMSQAQGPVGLTQSDHIPDRLRDRIRNYIDHRVHPGPFLLAVLAGDLFIAAIPTRADVDLASLARFIIRNAPPESWGSAERVSAWLAGRGRAGPGVRAVSQPRRVRYDGGPLSL